MPRFTRFVPLLLLALAPAAQAKDWIRRPAISPDGARVAFTYRGDLWLVSAKGGDARLLTSHVGHETDPVWSPDSRRVAFASDRHGHYDVFVIDARGGSATRLTYHSSHDTPACFSADGSEVFFSSTRLDAPKAALPSARLGELYAVSIKGGRPRQVLTTPAERARLSPDGKRLAYHDRKGGENRWRKHHVSSVTRDLWVYDLAAGKHTRLTKFRGEDRNPVWSADGQTIHFLSERKGSFNVWRRDPSGALTQVTQHAVHPVRSLSAAADGTLAYGFNGEVWVRPPAGPARKLAIGLAAGDRTNAVEVLTERKGATEMALAPSGEEVAFVVRGEVFVASLEHGTTRQVTRTTEQERGLSWAPDGRTLYYASERRGSWNLYASSLADEAEQRFSKATLLKERAVLEIPAETFQPRLSPDGKQLAFLLDRDAIAVLDLKSGARKTIVSADLNYSYSDGDIQFRWSPDSRWLAFNYLPTKRWISDVGVANVATGELTNVTRSGYEVYTTEWSPDGRALLFSSDRYGRRNHGSWGSDSDVLAWYFTRASFDRARLNEEDFADLRKEEKKKEEKRKKKKETKKKKEGSEEQEAEKPPPKPLELDFRRRVERMRRLTLHSAPLGAYALTPDGEALVYFAKVEEKWDLWLSRWRASATRKWVSYGDDKAGQLEFTADGKRLVVRRGDGRLEVLTLGDLEKGSPKRKPVAFAAKLRVDYRAERAHLFEHVWRQAQAKFYRPDLHGADWKALKANYAAFLPSINNNHDFAELLSELLGELNASHTGSGYRLRAAPAEKTAALGLLYDVSHRGPGLAIAEVLEAGPADRADSKIAAGQLLTHIEGVALTPRVNHNRLLRGKAGRRLRVTLKDPATGKSWDEVLRPTSLRDEGRLRYERWLRGRRALVERLSAGRVGYVHVRSMSDRSFRRVFRETLGRNSDKQALVVDTRFNGGGWLHEDLVSFLSGKQYSLFQPRGKTAGQLGGEPMFRWTRPVAVVQSEGNYSDAHIFPWAFKELKVGKLVGSPVPGTGTAVWWETLMDESLYFGIPQVGNVDLRGRYLENLELQPDVLVLNGPESMTKGEDPQLAKAVEVLLEELKTR